MITKLASWITKNPKKVMLIAALLLIPSILGFIFTPVNYDILSYLPDELDSVKGINILDEDFNEASMGIIIINDMEWAEIKDLENGIKEIEGVKKVLWLGALSNTKIPLTMFPDGVTSMLYSADGDSTLMMVQFSTPGASNATLDAIEEIQKLLPEQCLMSGTAAMTYDISVLILEQAPLYAGIAVVLALIALGLTMESFMLPVVMLLAIGIAILYNMGTNFMFGQISFITQAIASILQLAVTMDYSIFLMDRYVEEKPKYRTREAAMTTAIKSTFASLAGSSLTTVFGFLALCFMSFTLGLDIGLVMAKGVVFGILTVVLILPAMLLIFENAINKTRHRSFIPSFSGLNKLTIKLRHVIAIIFVILIVPTWLAQDNVKMYYNMMDAMPESMESVVAMDNLKEDFNMASMNMVLIDADMPDTEKIKLSEELEQIDGISMVMGLNAMMGTTISVDILPDSIRTMLSTNGKELMIVNSVYSPTTDECNAQLVKITDTVKKYDPGAYVTGEAPMYKDLIEVTNRDFIITNIISIAAVFILIAIIFKSFSIPLILVLSIEFAIWINIAISFLSGEEICFITPTIISCVQLGATVDYAILLTTRFREEIQKGADKKQAMKIAADSSHRSIFQSALVFFAATIGVYLICDIDIVRSICSMLARGAVISALVIMVFLTPVLVVCEGFINKTTVKWRVAKASEPADIPDDEIPEITEISENDTKEIPEDDSEVSPETVKTPIQINTKTSTLDELIGMYANSDSEDSVDTDDAEIDALIGMYTTPTSSKPQQQPNPHPIKVKDEKPVVVRSKNNSQRKIAKIPSKTKAEPAVDNNNTGDDVQA